MHAKMKDLAKIYDDTCNKLLEEFCNKQDMENDGWVGDEVGGVACCCGCGDYYFCFSDIIHDIRTNQPKGLILDWQDEYIEASQNDKKVMNYKGYTKGLRF